MSPDENVGCVHGENKNTNMLMCTRTYGCEGFSVLMYSYTHVVKAYEPGNAGSTLSS